MRLAIHPEEAGGGRPSKGEAPPAYADADAKRLSSGQAGVAPQDEDHAAAARVFYESGYQKRRPFVHISNASPRPARHTRDCEFAGPPGALD